MSDHCFIFHTKLLYQESERKCKYMKKLDPVVIIVDVLLLVGCGCMFLYGKMSARSLFVVGIILVGVLVLYLYVTNYKDNHYGGRFHKDF